MRCVQDTAAAPAGGALLTLPSRNLARLPPVWWYRYMQAFLVAVADAGNAGCLSTKYAAESIEWLDHSQADPSVSGAWMWTYVVFQAQYYGTVYLSIPVPSIYLSACSLSICICCLPGAVLRHATASQPCQPSRPQKSAHAAHARAPAVGRQTRRTLADALTAAPTHRAVAPVPCSRARRPTTKARRPARVPGHARPKVLGLCVPCTVLGCSSA